MRITDPLSGIPGSRPVAGVEGAWTWSLGPFRRYGFVDRSKTFVFRMNAVDGEHLELFTSLVDFARAKGVGRPEKPIEVVSGFAASRYAFDVVAVSRRDVDRYDAKEFPDLSAVSFVIFRLSRASSPARSLWKMLCTG